MTSLILILILFVTSTGTRFFPVTMPWLSGLHTHILLQTTVEFLCFISVVQITINLSQNGTTLAIEKKGLIRLSAYSILSLQAILFFSTIINLPFSLRYASALYEYKNTAITTQGKTILIDGIIGNEAYDRFVELYKKDVTTQISIRSNGGLIDEALQISKIVKQHGMSVHVIDYCSSACVMISSSSQKLTATPNSLFGFHRGSAIADSTNSLSKYISSEATNTMISVLRANGLPPEILDVALVTKPSDMHYVSAEKMRELGIVKAIHR
jgi:ATP-dependent protease ClpP protease subunit